MESLLSMNHCLIGNLLTPALSSTKAWRRGRGNDVRGVQGFNARFFRGILTPKAQDDFVEIRLVGVPEPQGINFDGLIHEAICDGELDGLRRAIRRMDFGGDDVAVAGVGAIDLEAGSAGIDVGVN